MMSAYAEFPVAGKIVCAFVRAVLDPGESRS